MNKKRGVSPIIATLLLIAIVVVLAAIIFLWARGFVNEVIMKNGQAAELTCDEVNLASAIDYTNNQVQITNIGNIPVSSYKIKEISGGTETITQGEHSLGVGMSDSSSVSAGSEIKIIPVLLGEVEGGARKTFVCKNEFTPEQ